MKTETVKYMQGRKEKSKFSMQIIARQMNHKNSLNITVTLMLLSRF